jgi:nucleoid-associated protein YgaU
MKIRFHAILIIAVVMAGTTLAEAAGTNKVGVMKFELGTGLDPALGKFLSETFAGQLVGSKQYTVVDWEEIDRVLGVVAKSQPNISTEDARKMAIDRLGLEKLFMGNVVKLGSKYHITVKLLALDLKVERMERGVAESDEKLPEAVDQIGAAFLVDNSGEAKALRAAQQAQAAAATAKAETAKQEAEAQAKAAARAKEEAHLAEEKRKTEAAAQAQAADRAREEEARARTQRLKLLFDKICGVYSNKESNPLNYRVLTTEDGIEVITETAWNNGFLMRRQLKFTAIAWVMIIKKSLYRSTGLGDITFFDTKRRMYSGNNGEAISIVGLSTAEIQRFLDWANALKANGIDLEVRDDEKTLSDGFKLAE